MSHALSLFATLAVLWYVLSGHHEPLLITLGVASCTLVLLLSLRMDVVDAEGQPIHLRPLRLIAYWGWLAREIVKSNAFVAIRILNPKLPLRPSLFRIDAREMSHLQQVIYANSITLTPGTVSIDIEDDQIEVHALDVASADELREGSMERRVRALQPPET